MHRVALAGAWLRCPTAAYEPGRPVEKGWYHAMISNVPGERPNALSQDDVIRRIERASPGERVSFAGENLAGIDLASYCLQRMDFTGANLHGADLGEARLDGSDFSEADLTNARMERASLRYAWLKWSRLAGADLRDADLAGAHVASADLATARLRGAFLDGAELSGAELPENWMRVTRSHEAWDSPFERRDVVAAVRRALEDEEPASALVELQSALGVGGAEAQALLQLLIGDPRVCALTELRSRVLPSALEDAIIRATTPPPLAEVGSALAALAGVDREMCRSHGLRWTISRVLIRRDTFGSIALLRLAGGLDLQKAKVFADRAAGSSEAMLEACRQVDTGLLAAGAETLASELWGVDFDWAVRLLWCFREGLRGG